MSVSAMPISEGWSAPRSRNLWLLSALAPATLLAGLIADPVRTWGAWLTSAFFFLSLALGALVFLALGLVSKSGWQVVIKRVAEALASYLPIGGLLLLLLLPGAGTLYPWAHGGQDDPVLVEKAAFLNLPFFILRMVVLLSIWSGFYLAIRKRSLAQDSDRALHYTHQSVAIAAVFLIVFGLSFSLASFDWLMSLEPRWYSTIFGLYNIGGVLVGSVSAITVATVLLHHAGALPGLRPSHLHDLGKLMFAFSTLWAYLWLSQYLLIWYANLPDETPYYLARTEGGWTFLFWINVVLNWALPFTMLLPRPAKRSETNLLWAAGFLLTGRWLDVYLMVAPAGSPEHTGIGLIEIGLFLGLAAIFVLTVRRALAAAPMVPSGDPYLVESLHHHS